MPVVASNATGGSPAAALLTASTSSTALSTTEPTGSDLNTVYSDFVEAEPVSTTPTAAANTNDGAEEDTGFTPADIVKFSLSKTEFIKALQDPGVQSTKGDLLIEYPIMGAFCAKLLKVWVDKKFPNLPKNKTRNKAGMVKIIVQSRKQ